MNPSSVQAMSNEALLAIHADLNAEIDAAQKPLEPVHNIDLSLKKRERLVAKDELRRRGVVRN